MNIKAAFLHAYLVQVPLSISPSATKAPFDLELSVSVKLSRPLMYFAQVSITSKILQLDTYVNISIDTG